MTLIEANGHGQAIKLKTNTKGGYSRGRGRPHRGGLKGRGYGRFKAYRRSNTGRYRRSRRRRYRRRYY